MKTILFNNNNILEHVFEEETHCYCNQCYFEYIDCRIDPKMPVSLENKLCNLIKKDSFKLYFPHPVFREITDEL